MSENLDDSQSGYAEAPLAPQTKPAAVGFDIGLTADNDVTYDIPFDFDGDGNTVAAITVVGKNSQRYKDADRKLTRVALKKSAVRGRPLDLKKDSDSDEFIEQRDTTNVELAVAATVGWFGLTNGGTEFPYSAANARLLYTNNIVVREKVLAAIENGANFLKR
jgi:hypothetical protein